jgi:hypothetical protein
MGGHQTEQDHLIKFQQEQVGSNLSWNYFVSNTGNTQCHAIKQRTKKH